MTSDDFKKLLDEALDPIKETQKKHTKVLKERTEVLQTLQSSVVTIENTL